MRAFHPFQVGWSKLRIKLITKTTPITVLTHCNIQAPSYVWEKTLFAQNLNTNTVEMAEENNFHLVSYNKLTVITTFCRISIRPHINKQSSAITTELADEWRVMGGRLYGGLIYPPPRQHTHIKGIHSCLGWGLWSLAVSWKINYDGGLQGCLELHCRRLRGEQSTPQGLNVRVCVVYKWEFHTGRVQGFSFEVAYALLLELKLRSIFLNNNPTATINCGNPLTYVW